MQKNTRGLGIGDWGLGIGDWGLGIGGLAQSPIPNPQSPIPNPQSPMIIVYVRRKPIKTILNMLLIIIYNINETTKREHSYKS